MCAMIAKAKAEELKQCTDPPGILITADQVHTNPKLYLRVSYCFKEQAERKTSDLADDSIVFHGSFFPLMAK